MAKEEGEQVVVLRGLRRNDFTAVQRVRSMEALYLGAG